jgi:hypothetical protein
MSPSDVKQQNFLRSAALMRACPGERIVNSAAVRSTDVELGHTTFRTLENVTASALTDEQAAGLGQLVRRIVNGRGGVTGAFDTVEDLCRGYLDARRARPTVEQTRVAMQRTLDQLRGTGTTG